MPGERSYLWEVQLSQGHWGNLPDDLARWYHCSYEREENVDRHRAIAEIVPIISRIVHSDLTARQQEVVTLYFDRQRTQVQIADERDIRQPTVSQHLNGKRRGGIGAFVGLTRHPERLPDRPRQLGIRRPKGQDGDQKP